MRLIGAVTVGRSDFGIYLPVLRGIQADSELGLHLMVSGMHLSPEFGLTLRMIEEEGFPIGEKVEMLLSSDSPEGIAKSMGLGTIGFGQSFSHLRPDILLVLGDRFEMHAAVLAALPFKIPVAHIHGGELTEGAMDDALRHCITKLSHLHFVATEEYARRVAQLGEEPWRIVISGAPGLDNLHTTPLLGLHEMEKVCGLSLERSPLLVTFHPVTLEYERSEWQIGELLTALESFHLPVIFTMPNADTAGRSIYSRIQDHCRTHPESRVVENLGTRKYFSLMAIAAAMVGNSSSGIVEAASFCLPVVNVGTRQKGRVRGGNVMDVGYSREEIKVGIQRAIDPEFKKTLQDIPNPYGTGNANSIIISHLKRVELGERLIRKPFHDINGKAA